MVLALSLIPARWFVAGFDESLQLAVQLTRIMPEHAVVAEPFLSGRFSRKSQLMSRYALCTLVCSDMEAI